MTGVGGAGGPGGAGGAGPIGPGPDEIEATGAADQAGAADAADAVASATGPADAEAVARLAAELDAGRISPEQAMAQLIEDSVAGLPPAEQAELRQMMMDLVAADPYLGGLLGGR